ncbi:hypothetical protein IV38_GL000434 [Lactobacillus selangorensis]|uniref:Uncharacterized protein n=1 Tax=Lactobacillus selangorensis TaxID=81857 RepID=A0A0R2FX52_9LACO|nr:hypothetical protein [Lactobacillus selangorensis]KRN29549.1 hypothetical protein IV38_GL000434 [Lactobacillus selangorensis]KRN33921.1 hypothetical protein IV40_GL000234 [Lactobacillus selangorensis]
MGFHLKRKSKDIDVSSHDFRSLLNDVRKDSHHFHDVQSAFDKLKVDYHSKKKNK